MMALKRRPMARPDWFGSVRSATITIDNGWVMPNPSPKIDTSIAKPMVEDIDGISPTAKIIASIDTARIFFRSNISSNLPNTSLMEVDMTANIEINIPTINSVNPSVRSSTGKNEARRLAAKIIENVKMRVINTFGSIASTPASRASLTGLYEDLVGLDCRVSLSPTKINPAPDNTRTTQNAAG